MRKFGKLKEKIKEKYNGQKPFADAMNLNLATLNLKLNGKTEFTRSEIEKICNILNIPADQIQEYFFY